MAKMAAGIADNLLLTTYLSARCPVFIAPAMDMDMLDHPATKKNIDHLRSFGNIILEPSTGELASGLTGKGRMVEPEEILSVLGRHFESSQKKNLIDKLSGRSILVTAGATHEPIDAVRYIGNHSSGKMGVALANKLADLGARVTLISGPMESHSIRPSVVRIDVETAAEMHQKCLQLFKKADGAFLTAAVADFRPVNPSSGKIKRDKGSLLLELESTEDIAASLGKMKTSRQFLVGFALETSDGVKHAGEKLKRKNFDFIALNSLSDKGAGFKGDTNKITIIDRNNKTLHFELKTKVEVAKDLIDYLADVIL
jgi:phosphopantothenoylcysteine decarboxylase/phosphopantothenate--cysteine ligase